MTTEEQEWKQVCHPKLTATAPSRYFVNKRAVVCSNGTGTLKPLTPLKSLPGYTFYVDPVKKKKVKLEEIMVHTFINQRFDKNKQYIFHKDGNQHNCSYDNLVVCDDLPMLRELEIARLEEEHPDRKYTVVRNVHATLTFERYLVSDAGTIYSLNRRSHLRCIMHHTGYLVNTLYCDINAEQTVTRQITLHTHKIVIRSFEKRLQEDLQIVHINRNPCDNALKNLVYATRPDLPHIQASKKPATTGQRKTRKGAIPLPPVTEETRWKAIGVLPWNGVSFSRYEVSDMGHVRLRGESELLKLSYTSDGYYACVLLHPDEQGSKKSRPNSLRVSRLVANAFVDGYSDEQDTAIHRNGDRLDNRAQNLEWMSRNSSLTQKRACPIVVSLVDDPKAQKEFPSIIKAQRELRYYNIYDTIKYHGNTFTKKVSWDGVKKMALIKVLPPGTRMDE
ncbi:hypothetical protein BJV82DRAFT_175994 [Fennellomyces sp. T-0311]|nr:hypothetical protein BJV82DRAFT_175994 [Fennellomyces sp. T-0311]